MIIKGAACVYFLAGRIHVHPVWHAGALGKKTDPVTALDSDTDGAALGRAIRSAFELSRSGKRPDAEAGKRVLAAIGVKSWRALERGARVVNVTHMDGEIRISPMSAHEDGGRTKRGLIGEPSLKLDDGSSDAELGERILELDRG